jgi:single-strand DNA-binding protein
MASYNKVILAGHLTRDVEVRFLPSGSAVGDFTLAVNRKWRTEAGDEREEVSFINCVAFGKRAETIAEYVKKGAMLLVDGRLKQETWEDKESGKKRSAIKVMVESFTFIGAKRSDDGARRQQQPKATDESAPQPDPEPEDNVPF